MGIESDQLVYDYLSRVGDAAQRQQLSSGDRMRLVSTLRNEIDRQRGKYATDSPAAVRRILGRLGEPAELVRAAAPPGGGGEDTREREPYAAPEVPEQRARGMKGFKGIKGFMGSVGSVGSTGSMGAKGAKGAKGADREADSRTGPSGPSVPLAPEPTPEPVLPLEPEPLPEPELKPEPEPAPAPAPPAPEPERPPTPEPPPAPAAFAPPMEQAAKPPVPSPRPAPGPDWWRIEAGPLGGRGPVETVLASEREAEAAEAAQRPGFGTGFVGGMIPEVFREPPDPKEEERRRAAEAAGETGTGTESTAAEAGTAAGTGAESGTDADAAPGKKRRRLPLPRLLGPPGDMPAEKTKPRFAHPFLLLAAALLVAGAFLGSWLALGGGWLLAYVSRTLSRTEAKWAVFGLPGVSAAGGLVWLWGRSVGRWGEEIPADGMADALTGLWPVVLRTAAVSSALFLVWRARRKA
ncbi:hypothetical protein [Streptomyces paludis]|uniref:Uncharacterized protein n=1 Tax=Streptomyces paludis TaxID=2282738 RepID=A0A345HRY4_9ACTN|nr:hypothetical protein [Streptomyces paludis]AXG79458.1 hypothetical protein DVK44_19410 [Streptomyces paludis]